MKHCLERAWIIDCCRDGTLTFRARCKAHKPFNGAALPVYSTDTATQAESLIGMVGVLQHDRHPLWPGPWYVFPDFKGEVEDLGRVTKTLDAVYHGLFGAERK